MVMLRFKIFLRTVLIVIKPKHPKIIITFTIIGALLLYLFIFDLPFEVERKQDVKTTISGISETFTSFDIKIDYDDDNTPCEKINSDCITISSEIVTIGTPITLDLKKRYCCV